MPDAPSGSNNDVARSLRLEAAHLQAQFDLQRLPASTEGIEPLRTIVAQDRAREAITFGLQMERPGYNIAVTGPPASGRNSLAHELVTDAAARKPAPPDWCYLYNFPDPYRPRAIALPAGAGHDLQRGLEQLVEVIRHELPEIFDSDAYSDRVEQAMRPLNERREGIVSELQRFAEERGFLVNMTQMGLVPVPRGREGQPLSQEEFAALDEAGRERLEAGGREVQEAATTATRELHRMEHEAREAVKRVNREVAGVVIGPTLQDLRDGHDQRALLEYFSALERDILENVDRLRITPEHQPQEARAALGGGDGRDEIFKRYTVNLFVTQSDGQQAPIVDERQPTFHNLFGRLDYEVRFGSLTTDFTLIRSGALHRALGGYLILQLQDVFEDPRSWIKLKRTLKNREVRVEEIGQMGMPLPAVNLQPEPIPADLTVVLVGPPMLIAMLDAVDPDFGDLFKIRAEFEPDLRVSDDTLTAYTAFVCRAVGDCKLREFDREALLEVLRYGSRLASRQDRLSSRFGAIQDLCQEADQLALNAGADAVGGQQVREALNAMERRAGMVPDRMRSMIAEGTLHIETEGARVGQVNGLAVYQIGGRAFGTPTRITCRVGAGTLGVVNIERQVERSGAIHSKGVLVLSGFLMGTFGRDTPLSFTASLTFEQSYDEVDGDSASSAELYAILTALAGVPIRQEIAVTGSVDQFGNIQPVGGVTQKVEGFFDVCNERGLTGSQGVILPKSNVVNLTLKPEVVDAVEQGRFSIWAVSRIEEGLELLTGVAAGVADEKGEFPKGSIMRGVVDALGAMRPAINLAARQATAGATDTTAGEDPRAAAGRDA